ncbi:MAG: hypothetical protein ACI9BD_000936 [Candidatus Marinamargulisbacteria bacterium]|jgi:hypothetical protein
MSKTEQEESFFSQRYTQSDFRWSDSARRGKRETKLDLSLPKLAVGGKKDKDLLTEKVLQAGDSVINVLLPEGLRAEPGHAVFMQTILEKLGLK